MRTIHINAKVQGSTHGWVTAFVLNPRDLTLTHLAVRSHGLLPSVHLVPLRNITQTRGRLYSNDTTPAAVRQAPDNEISYVPLGGWPHSDVTHDVGIVHVLSWPRTVFGARRPQWTTDDLDLVVDYDLLPKGLVELGEDSDIFDVDHHPIGHLRALVVDNLTGRLTALEIHRPSPWPLGTVVVPGANVTSIQTDNVRLNIHQRTLSHPSGEHGAREAAS